MKRSIKRQNQIEDVILSALLAGESVRDACARGGYRPAASFTNGVQDGLDAYAYPLADAIYLRGYDLGFTYGLISGKIDPTTLSWPVPYAFARLWATPPPPTLTDIFAQLQQLRTQLSELLDSVQDPSVLALMRSDVAKIIR